jgi:transposase
MSERDCNNQVEKRQRIKKTTLIIGVDIGSKFNAVAFMNKEGEVFGKFPKVYNSREGFDYFVQTIEEVKAKKGLKSVLIGMEPTGHYWRKIAFFAQEKGYQVRFVRTTAIKHQRELDESSSAKSDIKDAITLANITREGKYIDTVIEEGVYRQLRTLSKIREKMHRASVRAQNTLGAVLDDYFPELKQMFWSMKSRSLWAILKHSPFPQDILKCDITTITEILSKSSRRKAMAKKKARDLFDAAQISIGLKSISEADRYRLKHYLDEVMRSETLLKEIIIQMKSLLNQTPYAEFLLSIPGVGPLSAAVFLGELGDPAHFSNPKQMVKYAGYDPQEKDSGLRVGRKRISKKGRWLMRKNLFFMGMRAAQHCKFFKEYYQRKLKNENRFGQLLKKKEALCAVVIKLINVIFALFRDKRKYQDQVAPLVMAA